MKITIQPKIEVEVNAKELLTKLLNKELHPDNKISKSGNNHFVEYYEKNGAKEILLKKPISKQRYKYIKSLQNAVKNVDTLR